MKNKLIDLHNALFAELEALQDMDSFCNEDGSINKEKTELALKRADLVNGTAGKIMDLARIQLDAVKVAGSLGMDVSLPETMGIEGTRNGNAGKALAAPRH